MVLKGIRRSAIVGLTAAIAMGIVAFALAPFFDAVGLYSAPAGRLLPVVGPIILPVVDWLLPDSGAPAGVMLILICAISFWTMLFALAHYAWSRSRNGRRPNRGCT
jgi:hypothetical protein